MNKIVYYLVVFYVPWAWPVWCCVQHIQFWAFKFQVKIPQKFIFDFAIPCHNPQTLCLHQWQPPWKLISNHNQIVPKVWFIFVKKTLFFIYCIRQAFRSFLYSWEKPLVLLCYSNMLLMAYGGHVSCEDKSFSFFSFAHVRVFSMEIGGFRDFSIIERYVLL